MADRKPNPFTQDFQTITQSADDAVMEFLKQAAHCEVTQQPETTTDSLSPAEKQQPEYGVRVAAAAKTSERRVTTKLAKTEKPRVPQQQRVSKSRAWGKPTALFNTRIPQEMSELLDDLVYRLKKEGKPHTKQTIAIDALAIYLATHGLLPATESGL